MTEIEQAKQEIAKRVRGTSGATKATLFRLLLSLITTIESQKEEIEKLKHRDRVVSLASETLARYFNEGKEEIKVLKRRLEKLADTSVDISVHESFKAITELAVKGLKEQLQISKFSCSVVNAITIENILSEIERLSHEQNS